MFVLISESLRSTIWSSASIRLSNTWYRSFTVLLFLSTLCFCRLLVVTNWCGRIDNFHFTYPIASVTVTRMFNFMHAEYTFNETRFKTDPITRIYHWHKQRFNI